MAQLEYMCDITTVCWNNFAADIQIQKLGNKNYIGLALYSHR